MVTLTWIDGQIEKAIEEGNNPQNIRDLAALITVREYLATRSAPKADAQSVQESADDKKRRDAVVLMTHSADLDTVPTIQQVETALHSISVNTPEERKRVQDAKKWGADYLAEKCLTSRLETLIIGMYWYPPLSIPPHALPEHEGIFCPPF